MDGKDTINLMRVCYGGMEINVPEIWEAETEVLDEIEGKKSYGISINATGNDVRSIDLSYGPMPEGSDAYAEACGTYEEVAGEDDMDVDDEPILCFDFQNRQAYGFNVMTDEGLPCFFFCIDIPSGEDMNLLTVLVSAADNEELQSLIDFVEEYLSVR